MSPPTSGGDEFATWDAAYILGSLTPADRRRFEEHLAGCPTCREAVADLAGIPGLLALVPRQTALALLDDAVLPGAGADGQGLRRFDAVRLAPSPPDELMHSLVARTERRRRRDRWAAAGAAVAAVAAALVIAIPLVNTDSTRQPGETPPTSEVVASRTMNQVVATALSANFDLIADTGGGSRIDMECRYAAGGRAYTGEYSLWITTVNGSQSHLATWAAKPGDVVSESALIDVSPQDIRQVDIRSTATQQVLLSSVL